jgi:tetratricopeptide (TPR) repeat protein
MIDKIIPKISHQPYKNIFSCLLIILLTFVVYAQTLNFGLVDYDDYGYISQNAHLQEGFTYPNFVWSVTYLLKANWAPLTIWSYIADAGIYGDWYGGYHLTNIILHGLNGLLLFFIAFKLSNKYSLSLLLATLFIVHPQHVESVAWLSQRKDLLSTLFMFLSLLLYVLYKTRKVRHYYLLSIGAFMVGLMAKVIIAPLPVVLLLIDYVFFSFGQDNRNIRYFITIAKDKIPYFILALIFGGINYYAQLHTGALTFSAAMPEDIIVSSVPLAYWFYPIKTLAPFNLIPFYPYPKEAPLLLSIVALVSLVAITVTLFLYRDKYKYLFFGWFCYLIISTPMNGMFQTGSHAYADRYSYIANIGLLITVIAILAGSRKLTSRKMVATFAVSSVLVLSYLSYMQTSLWKDTYTLFSHALKVSKDNHVALLRLANEHIKNNEMVEAKKYIDLAIDKHPLEAHGYWFAVRYHYMNNQSDEVKNLLESALELNIWRKGVIYREMSRYYKLQGDYENAIKFATKAVECEHETSTAYLFRASAYRMNKNYNNAIDDIEKAISINRQYTSAYIEMGNVLMDLGYKQEARYYYIEALKQNPSNKKMKKFVALLAESD